MKYFKLTTESKVNFMGITLFRLEFSIDCIYGKKGEKGGWIESEITTNGNARVSDNALVLGNAQVYGNARVLGNAQVSDNALVSGDAQVYGDARVSGNAQVYGDAQVSGDALVLGNAHVSGDAQVSGDALVLGNAHVSGDARVYGDARVSGNARVSGGEWNESPLQIQGTRHFVTTSSKKKLTIGCKTFKFDFWKKNFEEIGKEENYTEKQILEYELYIDLAISLFGITD